MDKRKAKNSEASETLRRLACIRVGNFRLRATRISSPRRSYTIRQFVRLFQGFLVSIRRAIRETNVDRRTKDFSTPRYQDRSQAFGRVLLLRTIAIRELASLKCCTVLRQMWNRNKNGITNRAIAR